MIAPRHALGRSGALVALGVVLGAATGAAAIALLARAMDASEFVALAALTPVVGIVSAIGRFGFDRLAVRHYWQAPPGAGAQSVMRYIVAGLVTTAALAGAVLL